eukprot:COSAG01_NODE_47842_length_386_cov_1.108014_1_plen_86_part_00
MRKKSTDTEFMVCIIRYTCPLSLVAAHVVPNVKLVDVAALRVLRESIKLLVLTRFRVSIVRKARPRQAQAQNFDLNAPFLSVRAP